MLVKSSLKEEGEVEMGLGVVDLINFNEGEQNECVQRLYPSPLY